MNKKKQQQKPHTNHEENESFHSLKKKFHKILSKNYLFLKKTSIILPTITISSKMFIDIKHLYVKKCTYNPGALLLCLQPGLISVKGLLNDWFITENTGGRVNPGFLTAVFWVSHPRLQQHFPGPFYNHTHPERYCSCIE